VGRFLSGVVRARRLTHILTNLFLSPSSLSLGTVTFELPGAYRYSFCSQRWQAFHVAAVRQGATPGSDPKGLGGLCSRAAEDRVPL